MKKSAAIFSAFAAIVMSVVSCSHHQGDQVVAKAVGKKLYRSEVVRFIPPSVSAEDSLALAMQYINAWAGELIMNEMAEKQLSKSEKDVSAELEDYKNSLLKYKYEQHYIQERLDTVVTAEQIISHYKANPDLYKLTVPIVKARFVKFPQGYPLKEQLVHLLMSDQEDSDVQLDSLSYNTAAGFKTYGDKWVDIVTLARDFGMDYGTLLGALRDSVIDLTDSQGMEYVARIAAFIPGGKVAPLEYCMEKIRDIIISQRKYSLSTSLEQDLLDDALENGKFVIYGNDEK